MTGHGEVPQSNRTIDAHVVALPMPIRRGSQPRPLKTEVRPVRLSRKRNVQRTAKHVALPEHQSPRRDPPVITDWPTGRECAPDLGLLTLWGVEDRCRSCFAPQWFRPSCGSGARPHPSSPQHAPLPAPRLLYRGCLMRDRSPRACSPSPSRSARYARSSCPPCSSPFTLWALGWSLLLQLGKRYPARAWSGRNSVGRCPGSILALVPRSGIAPCAVRDRTARASVSYTHLTLPT